MPGHLMSADELRQKILGAMEIGVAHAAIKVRDRQSFLAPKLTDELAADIQANRTNRNGNNVTSRVHTQSEDYYGIFQEKGTYKSDGEIKTYKHKIGEAHYMANGLLGAIPEVAADVRDAVRGIA